MSSPMSSPALQAAAAGEHTGTSTGCGEQQGPGCARQQGPGCVGAAVASCLPACLPASLVPADCRMILACGVLLCCRYDGVMDGPMGPVVSATLGQMLDDFFQYAAELQQSLEQQGALHGCSPGQQDWPAQQLTAHLEQHMS